MNAPRSTWPGAAVSVLFARRDSVYKKIAGCDVWDADRDARRYRGDGPVIAHPPCRGWGRLKAFANPAPGEVDLAPWAVEVVRRNGGVLEHPAGSSLWREMDMPRPVEGLDEFGGWTIYIDQSTFGHRAQKATWLYVVGVALEDLPRPVIELGLPDRFVEQLGRAAREHTPEKLARWLVDVARSTDRQTAVDLARWIEAPETDENAGPPGQLDLWGALSPT